MTFHYESSNSIENLNSVIAKTLSKGIGLITPYHQVGGVYSFEFFFLYLYGLSIGKMGKWCFQYFVNLCIHDKFWKLEMC